MPAHSVGPSRPARGAHAGVPASHRGRGASAKRTAARGGEGARSQPGLRRCAVYTRKSSEEGLEQEYNSLHAQREACEAYIRSQQHEGWRLVPDAYDDGGLSGGSMERPGLQRLLADIQAGRVETVVVYKVDRLTRSLADFAKMVEVFDANGASFVAVTQQFNTTTSMGRLTLNILLSFAQFEREVTGKRIRDKIAASKRRGMWMGGRTPLGYDVVDRKLVVNTADAATVVRFYERYLALGCVRQLKAELDGQGVVSTPRTYAGGVQAGGVPYSRGALYALLSNPVYLGQVRHKGECHPGQHQAIVPDALHAAVQAQLAASNGGGRGRARHKVEPSPLAGKLFDETGQRLVPTHARKGERRYRYYVSPRLLTPNNMQADAGSSAATVQQQQQDAAEPVTRRPTPTNGTGRGWRLPAREIEQSVTTALQAILADPAALVPDMLAAGVPAAELPPVLERLAQYSAKAGLVGASDPKSLTSAKELTDRVDLSIEGMMLTISLPANASDRNIGVDDGGTITLRRFVPHQVRQRGVEMRLVIEGSASPARHDPALLKVVARAHCWFEELVSGRAASAHEIADRLGISSRYVQRLLPLAMLDPKLVEQIVEGQHDAGLTVDAMAERGMPPLRWSDQPNHLWG